MISMLNTILIPLGTFLSAGVGYLAVRAATGLGIGVISYTAVSALLQSLLTMAQGYYNSIPSFALQIVGLAGFGQAIGIIAGAITFRATFVFMSKLGRLPS